LTGTGATTTGEVFWVVEVSDVWDVVTGTRSTVVEIGRNLKTDDEGNSIGEVWESVEDSVGILTIPIEDESEVSTVEVVVIAVMLLT
jgi:hypothetical protein